MPVVKITRPAKRDLRKVPEYIFDWAQEVTSELELNPYAGQPLEIPCSIGGIRCFKLRKGDYRLVYCYLPSRDTVYVVAIDHRSRVYKEFKKRVCE